jgi:hypothetical protein
MSVQTSRYKRTSLSSVWDEFLLMLEVHEKTKTVDASALGIKK